jgi:hypothetical protein
VKIAEKTKFLLGQMIQCVTAGERYSTYASYSTRMREIIEVGKIKNRGPSPHCRLGKKKTIS